MVRLPYDLRPDRYDLHVHVDPRRTRFRGSLEIELRVSRPTRAIELHAVDLDLAEVALEDAGGTVRVTEVAPDPKRERIRLRLARPLRGPSARLRIRYDGPIRSDLRGLYGARCKGLRYAITQLEATDARRFLPCLDEPDRKARFRITVTTPRTNQVISNAPARHTRTSGRTKTVTFGETPPLSTYLFALIVGPLEGSRTLRCGKTPIRVWSVPGKRSLGWFALQAAVAALERLERYFALPYPYEKLDLIAVPDFEFGAMENAGAVVFREQLLLLDPKTATLAERKRVAEVIAHELAHMWYGNLVTMAWWDDLWLNEAFATWMAFRIIDEWKPEWGMWLDFEHHRGAAYALDGLAHTHPVYVRVETPEQATENFDAITYEKGASIVRMLERWLGASRFRRGVRRYIRRHREANACAADLWRALEEVTDQPVGRVARSWIEQPGFPLVHVDRADRSGRAVLSLHQERFVAGGRRLAGADPTRWPLPVRIRVRTARGRSRVVAKLVRARDDEIPLGPARDVVWAYANAEESGFYRPLHAPQLLDAIAAEAARLLPQERMGLVGHQWAGVLAGQAELEDWLGLVSTLRGDPEPEVLESLLEPLSWLKDHAAAGRDPVLRERFQSWLGALFLEPFRELGWTSRRAEQDRVRLRRAALLRLVGDLAEAPEVVAEAEPRALEYLRAARSLEPNLAGPVLGIAARAGGARRYAAYRRGLREAGTPQARTRLQLALAAFRDPDLVARTHALLLHRDLPTQDVVPLLAALLKNPGAQQATWRFLRTRWSTLRARISPGLAPRLVSALPALQSRRARDSVAAFFRRHPLPTAARALEQALERFDLDADLRQRTRPALRRWLQRDAVRAMAPDPGSGAVLVGVDRAG